MAYPARRDGSQTASCHYLDGVPVKIGESFRPPRKITLPLSYQQRYPVELLNEEYDFSLENQVLKLAETKRRGREASKRARDEQLATTIEAFRRLNGFDSPSAVSNSSGGNNNDTTNGCDPAPADVDPDVGSEDEQQQGDTPSPVPLSCRRPPDDASSLLTSLEPNSMLQPVQSTRSTPPTSDKPDVTLTSTTAAFNLADFEAESSPFDSVALRSLNDIEELRSVLLNAQDSGHHPYPQQQQHHHNPQITGSSSSPPVNSAAHRPHNRRQTSDATDTSRHPAHHHYDPTHHIHEQMSSSAPTHSEPFSPFFVPASSSPAGGYHPSPPPHQAAATRGWSSSASGSTKVSSVPDDGGVLPTGSTVLQSPGEDVYAVLVPIRNTRSTPDILKELGVSAAAVSPALPDHDRRKVAAATAYVQPQRPSSAGPTTVPDSDARQSPGGAGSAEKLNRLGTKAEHGGRTRPFSTTSSVAATTTFDTEPDGRALVRHVTEMGFPRARVARAVQKLGNDDKKVVEHLCMIQTLVEQGYNGDDAECALFLTNHVHAEAKEYLDLLIQFRDLGFDDESIKRALLHSDNNRDKALDYLVS